ncbi:hypothetical protein [Rhodomicrobium vannielii]|nr:hypothetical protein [Rhodomicrobium vannielii]
MSTHHARRGDAQCSVSAAICAIPAALKVLDEDFPDADEGLLALRDADL